MTTITLSTPFIYQNRQTGQPSSAPLTLRQLCRILCPAKGSTTTSIITPQTLLLGYDTTTNTYDESGWKEASTVPILKEACSSWYYESKDGVKGPVSTRVLTDLLKNGEGSVIDENTRVFCQS